MEQNIFDIIAVIVSWLKEKKCWGNISFWDFSLALFVISMFCRIVFHSSETFENALNKEEN